VVSARLTISQLALKQIDTLNEVPPQRVCVEESYPLATRLVSDAYGLAGDLAAGGVMLGSVESCAAAVLDGTVLVYLTDEPMLRWLAFSFYETGNLYVSPVIRANPLSFAYPAGSAVRPIVDVAVINLLTNSTWVAARQTLSAAWFPDGLVTAPDTVDGINVETFSAAVVLLATWLLLACADFARDVGPRFARAARAARAGSYAAAGAELRAAWCATDGGAVAATHSKGSAQQPHEAMAALPVTGGGGGGGGGGGAREARERVAGRAASAARAAATAAEALARELEALNDSILSQEDPPAAAAAAAEEEEEAAAEGGVRGVSILRMAA
jgi:hypothetical protein